MKNEKKNALKANYIWVNLKKKKSQNEIKTNNNDNPGSRSIA